MDSLGTYRSDGPPERARQECEITLRHSVACAEHALAREAVEMGRALAHLGLEFHPLTFVALRVLEEASGDAADPLSALSWFAADGAIDRSAAIAAERLLNG